MAENDPDQAYNKDLRAIRVVTAFALLVSAAGLVVGIAIGSNALITAGSSFLGMYLLHKLVTPVAVWLFWLIFD